MCVSVICVCPVPIRSREHTTVSGVPTAAAVKYTVRNCYDMGAGVSRPETRSALVILLALVLVRVISIVVQYTVYR